MNAQPRLIAIGLVMVANLAASVVVTGCTPEVSPCIHQLTASNGCIAGPNGWRDRCPALTLQSPTPGEVTVAPLQVVMIAARCAETPFLSISMSLNSDPSLSLVPVAESFDEGVEVEEFEVHYVGTQGQVRGDIELTGYGNRFGDSEDEKVKLEIRVNGIP